MIVIKSTIIIYRKGGEQFGCQKVIKALEKDDVEDIKKKQEALQETAMALASKVYEEEAKKREADSSEASNEEKEDKKDKKDKDVMDAEYEEK